MNFRRITPLVVSSLAAILAGCRDEAAPLDPAECTVELEGACWTYLGLEGKRVSALAETPWGLFAGTERQGIYRWDARTGRWGRRGLQHLTRAHISALSYVPTTPPRLLAAIGPSGDVAGSDTEAAVYASENGGRSWKPWDGGLDAEARLRGNDAWAFSLAADPGDPERLYLGVGGGVLRSEDGGRTWRYVEGNEDRMGGGIHAIVVSPARDGTVWAGGAGALFNALLLHTRDWGETWKVFFPRLGSDDIVFSLLPDPGNLNRLWAGMGGGVRRSDTGGATGTWKTVLVTRHPSYVTDLHRIGEAIYAVAEEEEWITPEQPIYPLGLYRSADGERWDTLSVPPQIRGAWGSTVDSRGGLLIGTSSGVWRVQP